MLIFEATTCSYASHDDGDDDFARAESEQRELTFLFSRTDCSTTQHNHSEKEEVCASWIIYKENSQPVQKHKKKLLSIRQKPMPRVNRERERKRIVNLLLFAAFLFSFSYFSSSSTPVMSNTHIHMSFSVFDVRNQEIGFYRCYSSAVLKIVYFRIT